MSEPLRWNSFGEEPPDRHDDPDQRPACMDCWDSGVLKESPEVIFCACEEGTEKMRELLESGEVLIEGRVIERCNCIRMWKSGAYTHVCEKCRKEIGVEDEGIWERP